MKTGPAERAIAACCGSRHSRRLECRIPFHIVWRSPLTRSTWQRVRIKDNRARPASQAGQGSPRQKEKKDEKNCEIHNVCRTACWRAGQHSRAELSRTEWFQLRHNPGYQRQAVVWPWSTGCERSRRKTGCEDGCGREIQNPQSAPRRVRGDDYYVSAAERKASCCPDGATEGDQRRRSKSRYEFQRRSREARRRSARTSQETRGREAEIRGYEGSFHGGDSITRAGAQGKRRFDEGYSRPAGRVKAKSQGSFRQGD